MSQPGPVPAVTFRGAGRQRGAWVRGGVGSVGFGVAALVLGHRAGHEAVTIYVVGVLLILFGAATLFHRDGWTTIDGHGLRTWSGPLARRHRSIAWPDIAEIERKVSRVDGEDYEQVRVRPLSGRPFLLPEPTNSSSPRFAADLATIRDYWQRGASPRP
jgi:hypothetical protein